MTIPIVSEDDSFTFLGCSYAETQGYEWVRGLYDSQPRLVARPDPSPQAHRYYPLKDNNLYRKFAALKLSRSAIRNFANHYGLISSTYGEQALVKRRKGQYGSVEQLHGNTLSYWKAEIVRMRDLIRVWEAVKLKRKSFLKTVIVWEGAAVSYRNKNRYVLIASAAFKKNTISRFKPNDVVKPALYAVQKEINARFEALKVVPRLVWCPGPRLGSGTPEPDHHQRIIFVAADLLGTLWVQFAREVIGKYRVASCSECGEPLQLGPGGWHAQKKTCGSRCRKIRSRRLQKP